MNTFEATETETTSRAGIPRSVFLRLGLFFLLLALGGSLLLWAGTDWRLWVERLTNLHPGLFLVAMSLLPVIGFPISAFYFFAGVVYGWAVGIPLCLAALAVNMSASYYLTRTLLRAPLSELVRRRGFELPSVKSSLNQFRITFLIRTVPGPPFAIQNYLLALAGIRFGIYLPVSLVGQGAIASAIVATTGLLALHIEPWTLIAIALAFLFISALVGSAFFSRPEHRRRARLPVSRAEKDNLDL